VARDDAHGGVEQRVAALSVAGTLAVVARVSGRHARRPVRVGSQP
jgi:hypothetical protein